MRQQQAAGHDTLSQMNMAAEQSRGRIEALIAANKTQEARQAFDALPEDMHTREWHARTGLALSRQARDQASALSFANTLRAISPKQPLGYGAACAALRALGRLPEAEAIALAGLAVCPNAPGFLEETAHVAEAAGNTVLAYERWALLAERCPASMAGVMGGIKLSQRLQQPAVTERLVTQGLAAFPNAPDMLLVAARAATKEQRWEDAAPYWKALIRQSPEDPDLRLTAAMSLLTHQRGRKSRLPKAMRKLRELNELFPDFAAGYTAHLRVLRECKLLTEAEAMGASWASRFPDDVSLAIAWADIAEDRQDFDQALARLAAVRARVAPAAPLEAAYARMLYFSGQPEEADVVCTKALEVFVAHPALLIEHSGLATRRGEWIEALRRARHAETLRPNDPAMQRLVRRAEAQTVGLAPLGDSPAESAASFQNSPEAFFSRFESLGATSAGCEFGLVQRRFAAEPLGLLRWANIQLDGLIEGLSTSFEHIGEEGHTNLVVRRASAAHQEYYIQDKRYGFWSHTFVKVEDTPYDRMLTQSLRRMRFLRAKLLEDLRAGEKIFVYKFSAHPSRTDIERLFAALSQHGSCTLLCVTLAQRVGDSGILDMWQPGLFVGTSTMFMDAGILVERGIDTELWQGFCERVATWHDANRTSPPA